MCSRTVVAAVLVSLVTLGSASAEPKPKRPALDMRVTPRMAFSPVNILVVAEMKGGDDIEEFYCPEIEWDWDDGGKSIHEADCDPFEAGTKIERRFSQEHYYPRAGIYNVKASFKRAGRTFLAATIRVTVRAGVGDPTGLREPPE
ncbi:MAG TPA: hypothetical protein VI589_02810 [Vicinamibacteria bacterium]